MTDAFPEINLEIYDVKAILMAAAILWLGGALTGIGFTNGDTGSRVTGFVVGLAATLWVFWEIAKASREFEPKEEKA